MLFAMRFDFRNPAMAGTTCADRYDAALDMAEWAERLGCLSITLSEHHASPDGYIPSPLVMAAALAARTKTVNISIAALIAPFYDPLRLAEDLLVLDHLSRGRIALIVAGGYVPEEFELYGVPMGERGKRVTEIVGTLRGAFTGEAFEFRGRTVQLTPAPFGSGPAILLGGSNEPAARRAARIADGFVPSTPESWEFYRDEVIALGRPDPGPNTVALGATIALAENVEQAWEQMGPYFLHETNAYGAWVQPGVPSPYRVMADLTELRASGLYDIQTPEQYVEHQRAQPFAFGMLHPLCGGMPVDLAWSSLRLFESHVLPALK